MNFSENNQKEVEALIEKNQRLIRKLRERQKEVTDAEIDFFGSSENVTNFKLDMQRKVESEPDVKKLYERFRPPKNKYEYPDELNSSDNQKHAQHEIKEPPKNAMDKCLAQNQEKKSHFFVPGRPLPESKPSEEKNIRRKLRLRNKTLI